MKKPTLNSLVFTAFVGAIAILPAKATVVIDGNVIFNDNGGGQAGEGSYDGDISTSSLVYSGNSSFGSTTLTPNTYIGPANTDGSPSGVNDGAAGSFSAANPGAQFNNNTLLYNLNGTVSLVFNLNLNANTGGNSTGYDISEIKTIAGAGGDGRGAQDYKVFVSTASDPTNFNIQIGSSDFANVTNIDGGNGISGDPDETGTPSATETTLTGVSGLLASNVAGIELVYQFPQPVSVQTQIREDMVFGTPSAPDAQVTPEPSTYALMLAGGVLLVVLRRRRAINS